MQGTVCTLQAVSSFPTDPSPVPDPFGNSGSSSSSGSTAPDLTMEEWIALVGGMIGQGIETAEGIATIAGSGPEVGTVQTTDGQTIVVNIPESDPWYEDTNNLLLIAGAIVAVIMLVNR